eukprot:4277109-Lingulodinium_polyedra.AAC.1
MRTAVNRISSLQCSINEVLALTSPDSTGPRGPALEEEPEPAPSTLTAFSPALLNALCTPLASL